MNRFLRRIRAGALPAEGAIGTRLMRAGLRPGPELDAAALTHPALLARLHEESRAAGVEALKTHTFALDGADADTRRRLEAAVGIARRAAGRSGFVLGSLGPLPGLGRRARWLAEAGVDAILLETFGTAAKLCRAVRVARRTGLPLIALMTPGTPSGLRAVHKAGADLVGVNCVEPEAALKLLSSVTDLPLAALPSAGLPDREGRHPLSPRVWAEGAVRLVRLGVKLLGGCCGTTPEHLRALNRRR